MSRYIDADEITKEKLIEFVGCQDSISFDDLLWMIKDYMPTADVVEVVHASWELVEEDFERIYICTACKNYEAWGDWERTPYCPNCGARMDGKKVE